MEDKRKLIAKLQDMVKKVLEEKSKTAKEGIYHEALPTIT
jgi:hypothetical protein